jgi:hypothetical protein
MIGFNDWDEDTNIGTINAKVDNQLRKDNKKPMPVKSLEQYHVSFYKEVLNGESQAIFDAKKELVYQCVVDVESATEAEKWANEHLEAVAELTNCLSWDEDHDLPVADVIGVDIVPLVEYVKHLTDATEVLLETQSEIGE